MPPFRAPDFPGLFAAVTSGSFEPISGNYSANLKKFIQLCLKTEPQQRPSAIELLDMPFFM